MRPLGPAQTADSIRKLAPCAAHRPIDPSASEKNLEDDTNILFIMCDQLRWDYLSCYGHPHLETPNIDRLAARGVRFTRAYCQAPLCGPSRASIHTGRYMSSHGVMANEDPLKLGELTLGDYMREMDIAPVLVGKAEVSGSEAGLARLGLDPASRVGRAFMSGGLEPFEKLEGVHPDPILPPRLGYNDYLRSHGYAGDNPWELYANSAIDEDGRRVSGWNMRHAGLPARVAEAHSETAFTTDRAIEFLEQTPGGRRWCLHLSYIKPHWPYIAADPYHAMYTRDHIMPAMRSGVEREDPHPVYRAFMDQDYSENFARDEVRECVIPTYMGLVKQVDDHLGRLLRYLDDHGLAERTMIAFTSDHGDYLGDHWLGEKDLFHECSARVPMIVCDPSPGANATRGTTDDRFVETVDLLPTFVEFAGGEVRTERVEGRSLLGILRGEDASAWREFAISEIDFSDRGPRTLLGVHPWECRAHMLRTDRWKYILHERFRPQLFDLESDPEEFVDLGAEPGYEGVRRELHDRLFTWFRRRRNRTEMPEGSLFEMGPERDERLGIMIGHW